MLAEFNRLFLCYLGITSSHEKIQSTVIPTSKDIHASADQLKHLFWLAYLWFINPNLNPYYWWLINLNLTQFVHHHRDTQINSQIEEHILMYLLAWKKRDFEFDLETRMNLLVAKSSASPTGPIWLRSSTWGHSTLLTYCCWLIVKANYMVEGPTLHQTLVGLAV